MVYFAGVAGVLALALAAGQPEGGLGGRPERPAEPEARPAVPEFEDIDGLLEAVETRDRQITSLRGTLRHISVNTLADDRQIRDGELFLETDWDDRVEGQPNRKFAVRFDSFRSGDESRDELRWFVFDGQWLAEVAPDERQFNKWQVVAPGERMDPFDDPGNSPFWVPLGREKERMQRIADVSMLGPTDWLAGEAMPESLAKFAVQQNTVQLRLVPKEGTTFAEKWSDVRIWFDRGTMLPTIYVAVDRSGDQQITLLYAVTTNEAMEEDTFSTQTPDARDGWEISVQSIRSDG